MNSGRYPEIMKRCAPFAVLVALVLLPGCDDAAQTTDSWGGQGEDVTLALVNAYDVADPYQTARFFSAWGHSASVPGVAASLPLPKRSLQRSNKSGL
jgi:hypothetical protein